MWGGRFDKPPADVARAFTRSFPVDRRMYREDIVASRAHAATSATVSSALLGLAIQGCDGRPIMFSSALTEPNWGWKSTRISSPDTTAGTM